VSVLIWVLLAVVSAVIGAEVVAWCPPVQRALLGRAAKALPPEHAERYLEEWLAILAALPNGPLTRLIYAVSLLCVAAVSHGTWGQPLRRALLDISFAAVMLVMLAPLLCAIALALRLTSSGPILVRRHERPGRAGKPFRQYAFRTIPVDELLIPRRSGGLTTIRWRSRPNRIGRALRRSYLDELPLLLNMVRGEIRFRDVMWGPSSP
jgi:hypothetical protein